MERNDNGPLVSAVIPAYNAERWISDTIESVLDQDYSPVEIVVVDDGSTDKTAEIAESFGQNVQVLRKSNGGTASARNAGIRKAAGEYVAFLDADDLWKPKKLKHQVHLLEKSGRKWAYSDTEIIDVKPDRKVYRLSERTSLPKGDILRWLFDGNWVYFPPSSVIVHRSIFSTVGIFDESPRRRISEDWDFWLQVAEKYPVAYLDEPVTIVRRHPYKKTDTMDLGTALTCRRAIIDEAVKRSPERLGDLHNKALAHLNLGLAKKYLNREERSAARSLLNQAVKYSPSEKDIWTYWLATWLPRPILKLLGGVRSLVRKTRQA